MHERHCSCEQACEARACFINNNMKKEHQKKGITLEIGRVWKMVSYQSTLTLLSVKSYEPVVAYTCADAQLKGRVMNSVTRRDRAQEVVMAFDQSSSFAKQRLNRRQSGNSKLLN
jgi:hypothetical protein